MSFYLFLGIFMGAWAGWIAGKYPPEVLGAVILSEIGMAVALLGMKNV